MTRKVLIIDDVPISAQMEPYLAPLGFSIKQLATTEGAEEQVALIAPDIILLDLHFDDDEVGATRTTGGAFHTLLRQLFPDIPVLIFSTRPADNSIPAEAFDIKPLGSIRKPDLEAGGWAEDFAQRLSRTIQDHGRKGQDYSQDFGFLIGESAPMREFARRLAIAAPTGRNILLRGEAGTGKELAARGIHKASGRTGKFVVARIATLPPDLISAALFGHDKQAFPSARSASAGMIADATGGTLFLDEIGDLPIEAQAALSGFLANRRKPSGDYKPAESADVRIVSATQFDRSELVDPSRFRRDLLDQLAEAELSLPLLRERMEDIPALFARTVEEFNATASIPASLHLRPETLSQLSAYDWPGNIREFRNVLASALMWTHNEILMPDDIDFDIVPIPNSIPTEDASGAESTPSPVELTTLDLAEGHFRDLEITDVGEARYKKYKDISKHLLVAVNEKIFAALRERLKRDRLNQNELSAYLFGDNHADENWEKVRGYVSQNKAWPSKR